MTTITEGIAEESHAVRGFFVLLGGAVSAGGLVLALTAGVAAVWSTVSSASSAPAVLPAGPGAAGGSGQSIAGSAPAAAVNGEVDVVIKDVSTPDGPEPAFVGPGGVGAPDLFSTKADQSVKVVVRNEDMMPHTFTAPSLGLDVSIAPGATTTFSFTPKAVGNFAFECDVPCGGWVMSHAGYMKGDVKVVA